MILVSVIIPTRNRSLLLKDTLESIVNQTLEQDLFEVLVIDNGSSDGTNQIVESYFPKIKNIRYFFEPHPGLHRGRHIGYKEAKSDILVYADDDIVAFPTWLEAIVHDFEDNSIFLVGGKDLPKFEIEPPTWLLDMWNTPMKYGKCLGALSLIDFGEEKKIIPAWYVFGCNFAIRRTVLDSTKGFHPDGVPFEMIQFRGDGESAVSRYLEDHHLSTLYDPEASIYHQTPSSRLTKKYFIQRAFRQGVEMSYIDHRAGKQDYDEDVQGFRHLLGNIKRQIFRSPIERKIFRARVKGYRFHKNLYNKDPKLREWVHKDNYLD